MVQLCLIQATVTAVVSAWTCVFVCVIKTALTTNRYTEMSHFKSVHVSALGNLHDAFLGLKRPKTNTQRDKTNCLSLLSLHMHVCVG